ncbi:hypothetical protein GGP57_003404 [Salinibacter ruber]|uniref:Uncharacterized protein n=1 Tax=Salinibacter ruber TaxID=146919 RepID=A0A9X2TJD4_9BACT|nr:hypothetical protein [Salinibacter ruber]MCS3636059.1 hypothetical protein [Salinibacter ruber]MCS3639333.1 hypothetical protein [Salinibacter ruber]MCS3662402.1 hypothetical protein [Salinibacter ruber]MCS3712196.1 hypothetical protein [Salinibacter ruber]MCS3715553.1 hypothetical protein [Salinibacter ruber]
MNDTTPQMQDLHRDLLMARSNEERFQMDVSMCQTARTIVWSSLPEDLSPTERCVQFFLRYYGDDLPPDRCDEIVAEMRSHDEKTT